MEFVRRVTAAFRENRPPTSEVPVPTEIPALAMITPWSTFEPPITALPTQKKALHAFAPFFKRMMELMALLKVDPIWKINCPLTLPLASRVSVPAKLAVLENL